MFICDIRRIVKYSSSSSRPSNDKPVLGLVMIWGNFCLHIHMLSVCTEERNVMVACRVRQERQCGTDRRLSGRFVDGRPPSDRMRRPALHQIPHRVSSLTAVYIQCTHFLTDSVTVSVK